MNTRQCCTLAATAACLLVLNTQSGHAQKGGTDIYHYMVQAKLQAGEDQNGAQAKLRYMLRQQGKANIETFRLDARELAAGADYSVWAELRGDSNLVEVATFSADDSGKARVEFARRLVGPMKKPVGQPHLKNLLAELSPFVDVLAIEVRNADTNTVLSVDLAKGAKYQYLVKRRLQNDGVEPGASGWLRLKGHPQTEQLSIQAGGLTADTEYTLALNDAPTKTYTTDSNGRLWVDTMPSDAPHILDIRSVVVVDGGTNSVLSATLP